MPGSRRLGALPRSRLSLGNRPLITFSSRVTNLNVSNPATCYKVLRRGIIQQVRIDQDRFEFEPESTPEVRHRKGVRNSEVPVSYHLRTHDEREKIGWHDDFNASPCIVRRSSFHRP